MRCGIELSADEILGEPDDQVVIHGHLHAFAERPLPQERPGHRDLVNQRNAAAAESGIIGLLHDSEVTDHLRTARGDKAPPSGSA